MKLCNSATVDPSDCEIRWDEQPKKANTNCSKCGSPLLTGSCHYFDPITSARASESFIGYLCTGEHGAVNADCETLLR